MKVPEGLYGWEVYGKLLSKGSRREGSVKITAGKFTESF